MADALIEARAKRARPVVMTTVAMVAGMPPLALGPGGDSSFRQPMAVAVAVIGRLITPTAPSLLMVPVVYTCVLQLKKWLLRPRGKRLTVGPSRAV